MFAERAARVVADQLIARIRGEEPPGFDGTGSCYIEFGDRRVARIDVDFFSTPGIRPRRSRRRRGDGHRQGRIRLEPPLPLVRPGPRLITLAAAVVRIGG